MRSVWRNRAFQRRPEELTPDLTPDTPTSAAVGIERAKPLKRRRGNAKHSPRTNHPFERRPSLVFHPRKQVALTPAPPSAGPADAPPPGSSAVFFFRALLPRRGVEQLACRRHCAWAERGDGGIIGL